MLDVGANKGDWTAQALGSVHASKELRVYAFEPTQATRSMLSARFLKRSAVTVQPYALSNALGEATFYSGEVGAGTNSLSPASGSKADIEQWHFELDRYFENNYVLVRRDSELLRLGMNMIFDQSNAVTRSDGA